MTAPPTDKVDVAVNVYKKPQQTAVTLLSLLEHSGQLIDKIYLVVDAPGTEHLYDSLLDRLADRVVLFVPRFHLWVRTAKYFRRLYPWRALRHSLRYQYAWEATDKRHLFITHNDVLYTGDVVRLFLQKIEGHIGVGRVGQCWNCPASAAGVCSSETYLEYRPTEDQYKALIREHPGARANLYSRYPHKEVWPLPECRLNEWTCLIDMEKARPITVPQGKCTPFGALHLDIGTEWFYDVHQLGHSVFHVDDPEYFVHSWLSPEGSGHALLFDEERYLAAEAAAADLLEERFGGIS